MIIEDGKLNQSRMLKLILIYAIYLDLFNKEYSS